MTAPKGRAWLLPVLMLSGAVLGMTVGGVLGSRWKDPALEPLVLTMRFMGTFFLSLLKAMIIPLVVTSIVTAINRMGDLRPVARVAGFTGLTFLFTTFAAVVTGIIIVNIVHPGGRGITASASAVDLPGAVTSGQSTAQSVYDIVSGMFPANLFEAAANNNILGLIVFSLIFGVALSMIGERKEPLFRVLDSANEALFTLVRWIVWLAPIGILGLVADRLGKAGGGEAVWGELHRLAWYAAAVLIGLAIHALFTLPLLLKIMGRRNPLRYAANMGDAAIVAFGTASSAATMAVTLRCAVEKNKVSERAAEFVIPIGTTVNMDGTALYEAVAVIFIAQTMGLDLSVTQQILVAVTATLAAIGAAAIPEAGLVTMVIVLHAVGLPAEGIGLLLSIDWILDRFRTTVNVWGDSVVAAVVDQRIGGESGTTG